jgi:S1/P1 Nuclease
MSFKRLFSLHFRQLPSLVLLVLSVALLPQRALAWGAEGHEIVALIALRELTPAARAQVAHLLGGAAMLVHDSNWADEIRDQRRSTGAWHYVDIPLQAPGYDPHRDCPNRDCVVAQIENDVRILGDRRLGDGVRAAALRFLIHFAADVHQPLHAEDNNDKGGNAVRVWLGHERINLHRVWDVDVIQPLGFDSAAAADSVARSISPPQRKAWQSGTPAGWANESHAIARDIIYPPLAGRRELRLPRDYVWRQAAVARQQLARAGIRLGWLMNTALR